MTRLTPKSRAERELDEIELIFKALAHHARRHILVVLKARGGQMTAGDIAKRFSCAWPTTTRHLRQLEDAGLVSTTKDGRESIYKLETKKLNSVLGDWLNWFNDTQKGE